MTEPEPSLVPVRHLRWWGETDRGKVRKNNEDSFLGHQFDAHEVHHLGKVGEAAIDAGDFAFAVSDGMGGAMAGEFASRITVEKITHLLPRSYKQSAVGLEAGVADVMEELFDQIHRALTFVGGSYEETRGMQATLTMCWFRPGWMYFGHVGDSRLYYLPKRAGGIRQLSHDDTFVGWLLRSRQLTEHQARVHPRRTALQKALGGGNQFVDPQIGSVAYEPGDLFLLCTDGIVEGLYDDNLHDMLRNEEWGKHGPARDLVQRAVENSGRDNTTALVIEAV